MSPATYSTLTPAAAASARAPIKEDGRRVEAGDPAAPGRQQIGKLPVPARQIQHTHARPQLQQPPGQLRDSLTRRVSARDGGPMHRKLATITGRGKEVQIILVVHRRGIEQVIHASEQ